MDDTTEQAAVDRLSEEKKESIMNSDERTPSTRKRCVRSGLKKSMAHVSLAPHEQEFLTFLLEEGTEQELQSAQAALLDPTLFHQQGENKERNDGGGSTNKESRSSSSGSSKNSQDDVKGSPPTPAAALSGASNASEESSSSQPRGTNRRQERLKFRRTFAAYDQMWQAHEKGILTGTAGEERNANTRDVEISISSASGAADAGIGLRRSQKARKSTAIGINNRRGSMRRISNVTAAKVHRMSVLSSLANRQSSSTRRRKSSIMMNASKGAALPDGLEQLRREQDMLDGISDSVGSSPKKNDDSKTSKKLVPFSDDEEEVKAKPGAMARKKSVSFAKEEEDRAASRNDHENTSDMTTTTTTTALLDDTKEIKPCLIKKTRDNEETGNDQVTAGIGFMDYCSTDFLPAFLRFFAQFRRPSITDAADGESEALSQGANQEGSTDTPTTPGGTNMTLNRGDSFDETMSCERVGAVLGRQRGSRILKRTYSDDLLQSTIRSSVAVTLPEEGEDDNQEGDLDYYNSWRSYMEGDDHDSYLASPSLDFLILGTSASDESAIPHVLSPPLMQSLQAYLPWSKRGENYWLKYSMLRDGASIYTLLEKCRGAKYSVLAIETVDGDVFGAVCGQPWRKSTAGYYGSAETFLWRMNHTRKEKTRSVFDQAAMEREISVYPYSHNNDFIQVCKTDHLSLGGGTGDTIDTYTLLPDFAEEQHIEYHDWGAAIILTNDLLEGASSPCLTFCSPALCPQHADGSLFEVMNVEVWTLTPAISIPQAEQLECGQLFLQAHAHMAKQ